VVDCRLARVQGEDPVFHDGSAQFLRDYMDEFRTFIVRVLAVPPRQV
jgi:hypothetical protein